MNKTPITRLLAHAFDPQAAEHAPPIVDTPELFRYVERGATYRWEPAFEEPSILHIEQRRRFIGWEKIGLRWLSPEEAARITATKASQGG